MWPPVHRSLSVGSRKATRLCITAIAQPRRNTGRIRRGTMAISRVRQVDGGRTIAGAATDARLASVRSPRHERPVHGPCRAANMPEGPAGLGPGRAYLTGRGRGAACGPDFMRSMRMSEQWQYQVRIDV